MQFNFLGDSITAGAGADAPENMYTYLVCQHFGARENNFGVCTTRIAAQTKPSENPADDETFLTRAMKMPKDADFTFVFGGTNDYGHGDAPLGQMGDDTAYTFYGAMRQLCAYLTETFPRQKLCFILPLHRYAEDDPHGEFGRKPLPAGTLAQYIDAIVETLREFDIAYLDLRHLIPMDKLDDYTVDGLHPNSTGYKRIADALCAYLEEKGMQSMKKVALLGDSIRLIGYGTKVPELLGDEYEVYQPEENCMFAHYTMRCVMHEWKPFLQGSDVIHWNNGLWDVCDLVGDGPFTPLEHYLSDLSRIADVLLTCSQKVIFATTTPPKPEMWGHDIERIRKYNDAAVQLLQSKGVIINDLFTPVAENIEKYICDDLLHLSEEGIAMCAKLVADKIKSVTD